MPSALIGHTGFVGGNLAAQHPFDEQFNSKNIERIAGRRYETLVISGAPAAKWIANREPEADLANLQRLMDCIGHAQADHVVLISTVDVYQSSRGVDEATPLDPAAGQAYGKHRLMLERFVQKHFPATTVLRLPALFGPGLKKNAIYDLLNNNQVEKIHCEGVFQFYDMTRLWADIQRVRAAGIGLINIVTEPVSITQIACEALGIEFTNRTDSPPAYYDIRTRHDAALGGAGGYLYSRAQVLAGLRQFAMSQRSKPS